MSATVTSNNAPTYAIAGYEQSSSGKIISNNLRLVSVCNIGGPYFHAWITNQTTVNKIKTKAEEHFSSDNHKRCSDIADLLADEKAQYMPITADRINLVYEGNRITDESLRNIPHLGLMCLTIEHAAVTLERYIAEGKNFRVENGVLLTDVAPLSSPFLVRGSG